jgi:hypothetical protein
MNVVLYCELPYVSNLVDTIYKILRFLFSSCCCIVFCLLFCMGVKLGLSH